MFLFFSRKPPSQSSEVGKFNYDCIVVTCLYKLIDPVTKERSWYIMTLNIYIYFIYSDWGWHRACNFSNI